MSATPSIRTRIQYAAVLLAAAAAVVVAPAVASAQPVGPVGTGSGCTYTDADGYEIPIDDGQDVFVDGKIVSCRGGQITTTTAPKRNVGGVKPPVLSGNLPVLTTQR